MLSITRPIILQLSLLVCLGLWTGLAWAENTLSLDEAISLAVSQSPQAMAEKARLQVSEAEIVTAGARPNPSLMSDNGVAEDTYRLGIVQTFELGGKRRKRIAVAEAWKTVVSAETNARLLDLSQQVRQAYVRVYIAQVLRPTLETLLTERNRAVSEALERPRMGSLVLTELHQQELKIIRDWNAVDDLEVQAVAAREQLSFLMNCPVEETTRLMSPTQPEEIELSSLDTLTQRALNQRPEIAAIAGNLNVARREEMLAKASRVPDFQLTAGPDLITGEHEEVSVFVMGTVQLPVLNRYKGPIQESLARQQQFNLEAELLRKRITSEVRQAYGQLQIQRRRLARFDSQLLPKSQQLLTVTRNNAEKGEIPVLMLLLTLENYFELQMDYRQTLLDYQDTMTALERAIGGML